MQDNETLEGRLQDAQEELEKIQTQLDVQQQEIVCKSTEGQVEAQVQCESFLISNTSTFFNECQNTQTILSHNIEKGIMNIIVCPQTCALYPSHNTLTQESLDVACRSECI